MDILEIGDSDIIMEASEFISVPMEPILEDSQQGSESTELENLLPQPYTQNSMTNGLTVAAVAVTLPAPTPAQPILKKLNFLKDHNELYVKTNKKCMENQDYEATVCGVDGSFVLSVMPRKSGESPKSIGESRMTFLSNTGQIVFKSHRQGQVSSVTAGQYFLGEVNCRGLCANIFRIVSKTGGPNLELVHERFQALECCSFFKYFVIKEYQIMADGGEVGTITIERKRGQDQGHRITFKPDLDVNSRALILSTVMMLDELYCSTQFVCLRNIGAMGRMTILFVIMILIMILVVVFELPKSLYSILYSTRRYI